LRSIEQHIEQSVQGYKPVSLNVLESKKLLRRFDSKFIVQTEIIPAILDHLQNEFDILEIEGKRQFEYENQYYDTSDFKFFNQHHNGKLNRFKVRERFYKDSNRAFLEIKQKTSAFFTKKSRLAGFLKQKDFESKSREFVKSKTGEELNELLPKLKVDYLRITLVNKSTDEKVTIDRNIFFKNTVKSYDMNDMAIIEVKQMPRNNASPVMKYLNSLYLNPNVGFSKYCMGLVLTESNVKYNKFKKTLHFMDKLSRSRNGE